MCKVLFRAALLIVIGVAAGLVHARMYPRAVVGLPAQQVARAADKAQGSAAPASAGEVAVTDPVVTPAPVVQAPAPPPQTPAPQTQNQEWFISIERAKELYDAKNRGEWDGYFIDARPFVEFREGHIPGSMHIDKKYFDGAVPAKIRNYLPGVPVVIYCHGENCTDSEAVAKRLIALNRGIGPIYIIKDGYPAWVAAGHPVDAGEEVGFH